MKLKKLKKPIRIATAIILGSSAFVVMADPVFSGKGQGSSIYIYANNNSSSSYSCRVEFDYATWEAVSGVQIIQ